MSRGWGVRPPPGEGGGRDPEIRGGPWASTLENPSPSNPGPVPPRPSGGCWVLDPCRPRAATGSDRLFLSHSPKTCARPGSTPGPGSLVPAGTPQGPIGPAGYSPPPARHLGGFFPGGGCTGGIYIFCFATTPFRVESGGIYKYIYIYIRIYMYIYIHIHLCIYIMGYIYDVDR